MSGVPEYIELDFLAKTSWILEVEVFKNNFTVLRDSRRAPVSAVNSRWIVSTVSTVFKKDDPPWIADLNLVPGVLSYPSLRTERETKTRVHLSTGRRENLGTRLVNLACQEKYETANWRGHPTTIFGKISVRKTIWELEFSEHLLSNFLLACFS